MARPRSPLLVRQSAAGAILGAALGDALAAQLEVGIAPSFDRLADPGGVGDLTTPWGPRTAAAIVLAESLCRGGAVDFDLAPTSTPVVAVAARSGLASPGLLVDPDSALMLDVLDAAMEGRGLDRLTSGGPVGRAVSLVGQTSEVGEAFALAIADDVPPSELALVGAIAGCQHGISAVPSRWLTYLHGPGTRDVHRSRYLLRLAERLLGREREFPPDPGGRLGPRQVAEGLWTSNLPAVRRFTDAHPDGAVISLCQSGDVLDDHRVRRFFVMADVPSRTANPRLDQVLDEVVAAVEVFRSEGRDVLVHCHHGVSRTGLALRAWLMHTEGWDEETATVEALARWPRLSTVNERFTRALRDRHLRR